MNDILDIVKEITKQQIDELKSILKTNNAA